MIAVNNQSEIPRGCVLGMTMLKCKIHGEINHLFVAGGEKGEDRMVCQICNDDESQIHEEDFGF